MRRAPLFPVLAAALLGVGGVGLAADAPPAAERPAESGGRGLTLEELAASVLALEPSQRAPAVERLASAGRPDPWLLADEFLRRGEGALAETFAAAVRGADVEGLPAYVAARRDVADDPAKRARLARADAALAAGRPDEALDAVGDVEAPPAADVADVRLRFARGLSLRGLRRSRDASHAFAVAADAAERLGWVARATVALYEAGRAAQADGRYAEARSLWRREEALHGRRGERRLAASARGNAALAAWLLGDLTEAEAGFAHVVETFVALGDRASAAKVRGNLGMVRYARGDLLGALAEQERALASFDELGDALGAARTLNNVGVLRKELGAYGSAIDAHDRAFAVFDAKGDAAEAARALANAAAVHAQRGDFARALATADLATARAEASGDLRAVSEARTTLATIHAGLADHDRALALYRRSLAEHEARGDRLGAAQVVAAIGNVHLARGDFDEAVEVLERAYAAQAELGAAAAAAVTLGNLGAARRGRGDVAGALAAYEESLARKERLQDRAGTATTWLNIGNLRTSSGDFARAEEAYRRAGDIVSALGLRPTEAVLVAQQAALRRAQGDLPEALRLARLAAETVGALGRGLAAVEGLSSRERIAGLYGTGLSAAVHLGDADAAAYFLESERATSWVEALRCRDALTASAVPSSLLRAEAVERRRLAAASDALRRASETGDLAATRTLRAAVDEASEAVAGVVARIQREARAALDLPGAPVATVSGMQSVLDPGDALVLYGVHDDAVAALVVTPEGARVVRLGPSSAVAEAAEALVVALEDADADAAGPARALEALVATPLGLPAGARRVLVSPSGALAYVPFAVLFADRTVAYVPSGTAYRLLRAGEGGRGEGVLALGDPDYAPAADDGAFARRRWGRGRLAPLPGTRKEVEAVGDLRLLGREASASRLRAALGERARWRAVHLACHGLVDAERPLRTALAISADGEHDGFLSCVEVFRMRVPADLVVLSACETGRGRVVAGEGIVGLTRAFMYAGSPRVICSLWKVDDEATSALMRTFYELWHPKGGAAGVPTAEALRRAQDHVRRQERWRHPYYWAAWTLWGLPS